MCVVSLELVELSVTVVRITCECSANPTFWYTGSLVLDPVGFLDQMEGVLGRHPLWEGNTSCILRNVGLIGCHPAGASPEEYEDAREGLEKLLMTRIHSRYNQLYWAAQLLH